METVHNRWQSETQFQFQRITQPPPPPAEELPAPSAEVTTSVGDWERFVDPESGAPYWWNTKTGESTWEQPENDAAEANAADAPVDDVAAIKELKTRTALPKQSLEVRYSRALHG